MNPIPVVAEAGVFETAAMQTQQMLKLAAWDSAATGIIFGLLVTGVVWYFHVIKPLRDGTANLTIDDIVLGDFDLEQRMEEAPASSLHVLIDLYSGVGRIPFIDEDQLQRPSVSKIAAQIDFE